jgi:hypothetical protein
MSKAVALLRAVVDVAALGKVRQRVPVVPVVVAVPVVVPVVVVAVNPLVGTKAVTVVPGRVSTARMARAAAAKAVLLRCIGWSSTIVRGSGSMNECICILTGVGKLLLLNSVEQRKEIPVQRRVV